jgi:hypothetical protein
MLPSLLRPSIVILSIVTMTALTTKAFKPLNYPTFNPDGWGGLHDTCITGATNAPDCQVLSTGTECYIVVDDIDISPIYDSEAHCGITAYILRHNE